MKTFQALVGSSAIPVTVGNSLYLQFAYNLGSNKTITIRALILANDGTLTPFRETITLNSANLTQDLTIPLETGLLLNVTIDAQNTGIAPGVLYANIGILYNPPTVTNNIQPILSGYVTGTAPLIFPNSTPQPVTAEITQNTVVELTPPAAGSDITDAIGGDSYTILNGFHYQFVADANVALRRTTFLYQIDGFDFWAYRTRTNMAAGETWNLVGWKGGNMPADDSTAKLMYVAIPDQNGAHALTVTTTTANIQAGDQWQNLDNFTTSQVAQ